MPAFPLQHGAAYLQLLGGHLRGLQGLHGHRGAVSAPPAGHALARLYIWSRLEAGRRPQAAAQTPVLWRALPRPQVALTPPPLALLPVRSRPQHNCMSSPAMGPYPHCSARDLQGPHGTVWQGPWRLLRSE